MKMKSQIFGLMCAAILMLTGLSSSTIAQDNINTNSKMARMSSRAHKFVMMAGKGGMAEIEMARVALHKSSNDAVRQFADVGTRIMTGARGALLTFPGHHLALDAKARSRIAAGDLTTAIQIYERAQSNSPSADGALALGDLYAHLGRLNEANKQYETFESLERARGRRKFQASHGELLARSRQESGGSVGVCTERV